MFELYDILSLRNEIFIVEQKCNYKDCDYNDQNAYHLFSKDEDQIISYLRIFQKCPIADSFQIGRVLVKKEYRNQKIAQKIMAKAIEFLIKDLGKNEIEISAQAYLINFYTGLGFEKISEEYLEDNIPHIKMVYKNSKQVN